MGQISALTSKAMCMPSAKLASLDPVAASSKDSCSSISRIPHDLRQCAFVTSPLNSSSRESELALWLTCNHYNVAEMTLHSEARSKKKRKSCIFQSFGKFILQELPLEIQAPCVDKPEPHGGHAEVLPLLSATEPSLHLSVQVLDQLISVPGSFPAEAQNIMK